MTENMVKACRNGCTADFVFGKSCKTCGRIDASSFEFVVMDPADKCHFCPIEDVKYP